MLTQLLKQQVGIAPETGSWAGYGIGVRAVFPQGPRFAAVIFSYLASPNNLGGREAPGGRVAPLLLPSRKKKDFPKRLTPRPDSDTRRSAHTQGLGGPPPAHTRCKQASKREREKGRCQVRLLGVVPARRCVRGSSGGEVSRLHCNPRSL